MLFRKRRRSIVADLQTRLGELAAVDDFANFFGMESRGKAQMRGNGCLVASREYVVFVMLLPRREFLIPRAQVTGVERVRSHLGKTTGHELLKITFTNNQGQSDSAAWLVRDLAAWENVLAST